MTTPNWQHHSKKEAKRTLKPQALRQAKKRRAALKAKLLASSVALVGFAPSAMAHHQYNNIGEYSNQRAYSMPSPSQNNYDQSTQSAQPVSRHQQFARCQNRKLLYAAGGAGIAAAVGKKDSYGWSIPVGAVAGYLFGRQSCFN